MSLTTKDEAEDAVDVEAEEDAVDEEAVEGESKAQELQHQLHHRLNHIF